MAHHPISPHPADRLFGYLAWLYPAPFRDEYAAEMRAVFRRRWRDEASARGPAGMAMFSLALVWDTFRTATEEHAIMLVQDVKFALRTLARSPLFALAAILTIALGIGADTAIFSVVDHVLLRPLPFPQSGRLLAVRLPHPTEHDVALSVADFLDWRSQNQSMQSLAAFADRSYTLAGAGEPVMLPAAQVTDQFFTTLGVQPLLGRTFAPGDEAPGQPRTVVLSYQLWRTRFHEDPHVAGRVILLDARPHTILGVMGPDFAFPSQQDSLWAIQPIAAVARRGPYYLTGIARIKEGMTAEAATARMNASIYAAAGGAVPAKEPMRFYVQPLREAVVGGSRKALLLLFGAGTLVLLIACVNVANLLLGRSAAREREILLRISLGANTRQLLRQFLTESLLIALLGAGLGIVLAFSAIQLYNSIVVDVMPRFSAVALDGRVLLFTAILVIACGLLFGLAPTRYATSLQRSDALFAGRGTSGGPRQDRARTLLVFSEMALACVLVMGAGLLIRSYVRLLNVDPGARADHLMTFRLAPPSLRYPPPTAVEQFYERLLDRIRQIPGVDAAGAGSGLPPDQLAFSDEYTFAERPLAPREPVPVAPVLIVTPDYFRAIGLPILKGRDFTARDTDTAPPVAIISQAMAHQYFSGDDPIGKRIRQGGPDRQTPWMEIVGVAADARFTGLDSADQRAYYKPESQSFMSGMYVAVRTAVTPESIVPALRAAVFSIDKELALDRVQTMQQNLNGSVAQPRWRMALLALLSGLGLGLAGIGVYGVVAYSVARRTSELGIRSALGASRTELLWLVIRQGMKPVLAGLVLGIGTALALGRAARSLLFGIEPQDPLTLTVGLAVLAAVGLLACVLPALRAIRIDPASALRSE